jgi:hypothetical protein
MKKKATLNNLFFGLLGGICLFLFNIAYIYIDIGGWVFLLITVLVILMPMTWYRFKNKGNNTFGNLFKIGVYSYFTVSLISGLMTFIYFYQVLSIEQKNTIVENVVERQIMEYEGDSIDIFSYDGAARYYINPEIGDSILEFILSLPLILFLVTILALILKPKFVPDALIQNTE